MLTDQATQPARTRPRHRLRDWPVQVFEYGVTLLHPEPPHRRLATAAELPPAWRAEADRLQGLWNQLCAGFQEFLARRQALLDAQPSAAQAAQAVEEAKQRLQEANAALTQARARRRRTPGEALAPMRPPSRRPAPASRPPARPAAPRGRPFASSSSLRWPNCAAPTTRASPPCAGRSAKPRRTRRFRSTGRTSMTCSRAFSLPASGWPRAAVRPSRIPPIPSGSGFSTAGPAAACPSPSWPWARLRPPRAPGSSATARASISAPSPRRRSIPAGVRASGGAPC